MGSKKTICILLACVFILLASSADAATKLYFRRIIREPGDGAQQGRALAIGKGAGTGTLVKDTFTGNGAEGAYNSTSQFTNVTSTGITQIWISNPLASGATISGTVTFNLWANENNLAANACVTAELLRLDASGNVLATIATGVRRDELTTSSAVQNWTRTPTSTAVSAGERLGIRVYIDDANGVTMATPYTVTITMDGTSDNINGDSYVSLTEDLSFADDTLTATVKSAGGDYTSIAIWMTYQQADLVTNKWNMQAEIYSMSDTSSFSVTGSGWTVNTSYYIRFYSHSTARHPGTWSDTKQRLLISGTAITINKASVYVKLDGLQIRVTSAGSDYGINISSAGIVEISNCIIKGVITGTGSSFGINPNASATTSYIWNNVIYDWNNGNNALARGVRVGAGNVYLYNNTFHNCSSGADTVAGSGTQIARNNLFKSCTTAASGTWEANTDYNATDNAGMNYTVTGGGNTHDRLSQTFLFMDEAADNFHLQYADSAAKENGLSDPGSGLFSTDIDGQSRPVDTSWDIGADETDSSAVPGGSRKDRFFQMF